MLHQRQHVKTAELRATRQQILAQVGEAPARPLLSAPPPTPLPLLPLLLINGYTEDVEDATPMFYQLPGFGEATLHATDESCTSCEAHAYALKLWTIQHSTFRQATGGGATNAVAAMTMSCSNRIHNSECRTWQSYNCSHTKNKM